MPIRTLLDSIPPDGPPLPAPSKSSLNGNGHSPSAGESLNVCLLSYRSNPYSGGQGVYVKYLSRELARRGHSVDVVSGQPYPDLHESVNLIKLPGLNLYDREERLGAFEPSFLRNLTDLFEWFSVNTGGFPEPYTFGRRVLDYFRRKSPHYDVIHDNQSLSYGLLRLCEAGYPVVSTVHHPITIDRDFDLAETEDRAERLLVRRWYNFLNMQSAVARDLEEIVCVSESSRRRVVEDFQVDRGSTNVVHNGIDTDHFEPLDGTEEQPRRIMTTASADVPIKGLKYLLRAVRKLKTDFPEIELIVVGELNDGGSTESLIEKLNLRETVEFHTHISHQRLVELYATASVAVCPSLYEGFGLPAGEAMACGLPLVSTKGGALPEVVGSCGKLVDPGNPSQLAEGIRHFLENPEARRREGRRGRRRMLNLFGWDQAAQQTESIYRRTIARADG